MEKQSDIICPTSYDELGIEMDGIHDEFVSHAFDTMGGGHYENTDGDLEFVRWEFWEKRGKKRRRGSHEEMLSSDSESEQEEERRVQPIRVKVQRTESGNTFSLLRQRDNAMSALQDHQRDEKEQQRDEEQQQQDQEQRDEQQKHQEEQQQEEQQQEQQQQVEQDQQQEQEQQQRNEQEQQQRNEQRRLEEQREAQQQGEEQQQKQQQQDEQQQGEEQQHKQQQQDEQQHDEAESNGDDMAHAAGDAAQQQKEQELPPKQSSTAGSSTGSNSDNDSDYSWGDKKKLKAELDRRYQQFGNTSHPLFLRPLAIALDDHLAAKVNNQWQIDRRSLTICSIGMRFMSTFVCRYWTPLLRTVYNKEAAMMKLFEVSFYINRLDEETKAEVMRRRRDGI